MAIAVLILSGLTTLGWRGAAFAHGGAWTVPVLTHAADAASVSISGVVGAATHAGGGYWVVTSTGDVVSVDAPSYGSMAGHPLNKPIVGMAATPDGGGYWLIASDGGIFTFGDAGFYGSMGAHPLNQPIVGMAADTATGGYWEVAADGGIFSFRAPFLGSMGAHPLNKPIVGMAATPDGGGYWLVASDGGIFTFGDARFSGSMGGHPLNQPVVGMAADTATGGYWEVAADGGVFSFNAPFLGSTVSGQAGIRVAGMATTSGRVGYVVIGANGTAYPFLQPQSPPTPTPPPSTPTTPATAPQDTTSASPFVYGFDLSVQGPDTSAAARTAAAAARNVLGQFAGSMMDESIYGFGAYVDPEPSPGVYDMTGIAHRLALILSAGGTPVMSLIGTPGWMHPGTTTKITPPTPAHYQDFAALCAHIAASFPQVKYFVVWNELKGFWRSTSNSWDAQDYTTMYNDVYLAIKAVRPTAQVGGPYAPLRASTGTLPRSGSPVSGPFGFVSPAVLGATSYWLAHNVGADFVAVDGATINGFTGTQVVDAVTAASQYAAVDRWLRSQTNLPIWWVESHISPTGWSTAQGAAARIATLAEMSASGATVGMQWQPQDVPGWPDEGLWTTTMKPGGGQPTPLAGALRAALPILRGHPQLAVNEPAGVLVAGDAVGTVAVNTNGSTASATIGGRQITLAPGQVLVS